MSYWYLVFGILGSLAGIQYVRLAILAGILSRVPWMSLVSGTAHPNRPSRVEAG